MNKGVKRDLLRFRCTGGEGRFAQFTTNVVPEYLIYYSVEGAVRSGSGILRYIFCVIYILAQSRTLPFFFCVLRYIYTSLAQLHMYLLRTVTDLHAIPPIQHLCTMLEKYAGVVPYVRVVRLLCTFPFSRQAG